MAALDIPENRMRDLDIAAVSDDFFVDVAGLLTGALEETVGLADAAAFVSVVGERIGTKFAEAYGGELDGLPGDPAVLAAILVDLKRRIGGAFRVESLNEREIVLVNARCPFAGREVGHPSLCMMTTNVFGRIVADARGYARVQIDEALATGHGRCRVRIALERTAVGEGVEFFK